MASDVGLPAVVWIAIVYLIGCSIMLDIIEGAPFDDEHRYSDD